MAEQENFALCDECGVNEACYTVSVMMGEEVTQRRLCPDCMARMNMGLSQGNVRKKMLSAILGALTGIIGDFEEPSQEDAPEDEADAAVVCEGCGTTLHQFTKTGKLGCPGCYTAFREKLTPMLQQIHGRVQHAGRKPTQDEAAQHRRSAYERLTRHLEAAVACEDYETAAVIRDQLRRMDQEGGGEK